MKIDKRIDKYLSEGRAGMDRRTDIDSLASEIADEFDIDAYIKTIMKDLDTFRYIEDARQEREIVSKVRKLIKRMVKND